jgi:hypothetical protein
MKEEEIIATECLLKAHVELETIYERRLNSANPNIYYEDGIEEVAKAKGKIDGCREVLSGLMKNENYKLNQSK